MTKPRKLHQLTVTIENAWLGYANSKQWKNQPFYCLDIIHQTQWGEKQDTVYALANLVSKECWKVLQQKLFKGKKYLLFCENRARGWRLKEVKEL